MTGSITPQQTQFLYLLSKTGFLTNKHLEQIGFAKTQNSKHYLTKRLLDGRYIGRLMVSSGFGFGRKVMYFLVKRGAELVAQAYNLPLESLSYSPLKGGIYTAKNGDEVSLIRADFIHKEAYICAFLAFEAYLENTDYDLTDYRHYYQLKGDKSTTISVNGKNIRPDGIWWATSHEAGAKILSMWWKSTATANANTSYASYGNRWKQSKKKAFKNALALNTPIWCFRCLLGKI